MVDARNTLLVTGNGDVIEPERGIAAIGSGGSFALAAARALLEHSTLERRQLGAVPIPNDLKRLQCLGRFTGQNCLQRCQVGRHNRWTTSPKIP